MKQILPLGCLGILLQAAALILAGGEAGNQVRRVILPLFTSALLAICLATMWRVQENSLKRGIGKGTLGLMALYGGIALYFLLFSALTVGVDWTPIIIGLIILGVIGILILISGEAGGPVNRFRAAMVPFLISLFIGLYTLSGSLQAGQAAVPFVISSILSYVLVLQVMVAMAFPTTLLGRWLENGYEEKCRWDAFRAFLGDFAMIRKYSPGDLSLWGDWLVYGTALGVGDRVIKAMGDLEIQIPEAEFAPALREGFTSLTRFSLGMGKG
ncbi:MAG TPA: hypothetical protein VEI51_02775 [Methanomicrobiales archaeon]|nr:hypothetical protein [Methanomicrobiales archaeon]